MKKPLNKNLRIRLNEDEEKILLDLAVILGERSRSCVVRRMIREAGGQGPDLLSEGLNVFRDGIRQQAALGRNLNQIARALNSGQAPEFPWDVQLLNALSVQVADLKKELIEIVLRSRNRWFKPPIGWLCPGCRQVTNGRQAAS
jgi:hypothetical protein